MYILLPLAILLFCIAIWLWRFSARHRTKFEVRFSYNTLQKTEISFVSRKSFVSIAIIRAIRPIKKLFKSWHIVKIQPRLGLFFYDSLRTHETYYSKYVGEAKLPKSVYVGDSENISIELLRLIATITGDNENFSVSDIKDGKSITMQIKSNDDSKRFLEVELRGASFKVDPVEKKLRQPLSFNKLFYLWNCYFPNSGRHQMVLIFNLIDSSSIKLIGKMDYVIKVKKLAFFSQGQVHILAALVGLVSFIAALAGIIVNFPVILHIFGWR